MSHVEVQLGGSVLGRSRSTFLEDPAKHLNHMHSFKHAHESHGISAKAYGGVAMVLSTLFKCYAKRGPEQGVRYSKRSLRTHGSPHTLPRNAAAPSCDTTQQTPFVTEVLGNRLYPATVYWCGEKVIHASTSLCSVLSRDSCS